MDTMMIDDEYYYLKPTTTHVDMAYIDKEETISDEDWNIVSELEEDETICDDDDDLSQLTDYFEHDDDIMSSCSSIDSDVVVVDEIHCICSPRGATRVRFAPTTSRYFTMSLNEYTQDEIEETWWTLQEQEALHKGRRKTVERLEAGLEEEKTSAPYRGLEGVARECYQHVMKTRKAYVNTVIGELERQRNNEIIGESWLLDWEKIASLTEEITYKSAHQAALIALHDENEARAAYQQQEQTINEEQQQEQLAKSSELDCCPILVEQDDEDHNIMDQEADGKSSNSWLRSSILLTKERRGIVSPTTTTKTSITKKKKTSKPISTIRQSDDESYTNSGFAEEEGQCLLSPRKTSPRKTTIRKKSSYSRMIAEEGRSLVSPMMKTTMKKIKQSQSYSRIASPMTTKKKKVKGLVKPSSWISPLMSRRE